jgi:maleylacetoacetate isomerase
LEYLEERFPTPPLLPKDAADRAWVRAVAAHIACDIHPLNNLRVLQYIEGTLHASAEAKTTWIQHWITLGFEGLEQRFAGDGRTGSCCYGEVPTLADCCLVPQVFSARRFGVMLDRFPTIKRIDAHLAELDAFQRAAPGRQADAE